MNQTAKKIQRMNYPYPHDEDESLKEGTIRSLTQRSSASKKGASSQHRQSH